MALSPALQRILGRSKAGQRVAEIVEKAQTEAKRRSSSSGGSKRSSSSSSSGSSSSGSSNKSSNSILPDEKPKNVSQNMWDILKHKHESGDVPSLYDTGSPLEGEQPTGKQSSGISSSNTQEALEDAPYSPVKSITDESGGKSHNPKYYNINTEKSSISSKKTNPSEDDSLTKSDLQENLRYNKNILQDQYQDFKQSKESIDPNAKYYLTAEQYNKFTGRTIAGEGVEVSGSYLLQEYYNPAEKDFKNAFKSADKNWKKVSDLPDDVIIKETEKGYTFNIPDRSLDWTKEQFKSMEKKTNNVWDLNLFNTGRKVGFGVVSSFGALFKPAIDFAGDKLGFDSPTKDIHFVSAFDMAFEPIGWSPEGSTEFLKDPAFLAGQIGGEWVQGLGITKLLKGGAKVGSKSIKTMMKGTANFLDDVPEISQLLKQTIQHSDVGGKVWSEVGENAWKWGTQGYKPIMQTGKSGATSIFTKSSDDITQSIKSGGKTVWKKTRGLSKEFVSPEEYAKISDDMANLLKKSSEVINVKDPDVINRTIYHKGKIKGIFKKRLVITDWAEDIKWKKPQKWGLSTGDEFKYSFMRNKKTGLSLSDIGDYTTKLKSFKGTFKDVDSSFLLGAYRNTDDGISVLVRRADKWKTAKKTVHPTSVTRGTRKTKWDFFEQVAESKSFFKKGDYGWLQKPSVLKADTLDLSSTPFKGWVKRVSDKGLDLNMMLIDSSYRKRIGLGFKRFIQDTNAIQIAGEIKQTPSKIIDDIMSYIKGGSDDLGILGKSKVYHGGDIRKIPLNLPINASAKISALGFQSGLKMDFGVKNIQELENIQKRNPINATDIELKKISDVGFDNAWDVDFERDVVPTNIQDIDSTLKFDLDTDIKHILMPKFDGFSAKIPSVTPKMEVNIKPPVGLMLNQNIKKKKTKFEMEEINFNEIGKFRSADIPNPLANSPVKFKKGGIF